MHKRILVTGAKGQVGSEIRILAESGAYDDDRQFFFTNRESLDITDRKALETFIVEHGIDTVINCAAYTAVDKAEEDATSAYSINRDAVTYLAEIARQRGLRLIHISTDYVFDGMHHKPLKEDDPTSPQGIYARSKYEGEEAIFEIAPAGAIIIRTSWVYNGEGQNFVNTMLRLGKERDTLNVVSDQVGTPTYAKDLARVIMCILDQKEKPKKHVSLYHYSNEGVCSWYDFAKAIFEMEDIVCDVNPIPTEAYPTPAKRPAYSVLDKTKIKQTYGLKIPYWRDALKECLHTKKQQ
jgi:dTDP-4-dehydrorhamnose reductase